MKAFTDTVSLWRHGFGLGVINVVDRQVKLVIMMINSATVFRTSVGQYTQHRKLLLPEERQNSVIEYIG